MSAEEQAGGVLEDWAPFGPSPDRALLSLLPAVAPGPMLFAGHLPADLAEVLREAGFEVEEAAYRPDVTAPAASPGAGYAALRAMDVSATRLPHGHYAFIVLDGVLPLLSPAEGDRLLTMARGATRPGGIVYVSGLTTDDPAFEDLGTDAAETARHAIRVRDGRWARFLVPGELAMAFDGWMVLMSRHGAETDARGRARSISALAARRPSTGSLLA